MADEISSYTELRVIEHRGNWTIDLTANNGPDLPATDQDVIQFWDFPLQELFDNANEEVAEIVALEHLWTRVNVQEEGNAGTTPGNVHAEPDVILTGGTIGFPSSPTDHERNAFLPTSDWQDSATSSRNFWQDGHQKLATALAFYTSGFNDTPNGTGGMGTASISQGGGDYWNYRKEFGRGPLIRGDEGGDLKCQGVLSWEEVANQSVHVTTAWKSYWDVFELEEPLTRVGPFREVN